MGRRKREGVDPLEVIGVPAVRSTYREAKRCRSIRSSMRAEARRGAWPACARDVGCYGITAPANTVEAVSGNNKIMSDTDATCEGRSQCLGINASWPPQPAQ